MTLVTRKSRLLDQVKRLKEKDVAGKHGSIRPIFCGGCGHFAAIHAIYNAMHQLNISAKNLVVVSGIGCSGRTPGFVNAFGFHSVHGRALPVATGVKLADPDLHVIVVGGDGDGLGIGGGHLPHVARMNTNVTYLLLDNSIYGLTKGQVAPTTPIGSKTSTTPYGNPGEALDPIKLALVHGATFIARGFSGYSHDINEMVVEGILHQGFSMIQILSPCVTFNKEQTYQKYYEACKKLPEDYDRYDYHQAIEKAMLAEETYLGVFYQKQAPTLEQMIVPK